MIKNKHWSEVTAQKVVNKFPNEQIYTSAAGITPSGRIHIGNFRDLITADLVHKNLLEMGKNSRLIFSWDDYDRFRKVPQDVSNSFKEFIGKPLTDVPDPDDKYESYAKRFEFEFEEVIKEFGIEPEFIYQSKEYQKGRYSKEIIHSLKSRHKLGSILNKFKTQNLNVDKYFPITIYSRFSGKDNTEILAYDDNYNELMYRCKDTGEIDTLNLKENFNVKLPWRIDWPMRWMKEGVNFEPGGKDHSSPGGSYEVGNIIAREMFGILAPEYLGYEFIGIKGLTGKMSGSTGFNVTPKDCLEIYEPELIKWLFTKVKPSQNFDLAFDSEVIRQYEEFDRETRKYFSGKLSGVQKRSLELSRVSNDDTFYDSPIPIRQAIGFGQSVGFDRDKLDGLLLELGSTFDDNSLDSRMEKGKVWLEKYNVDNKVSLRSNPNWEYFSDLNENEKSQLMILRSELQNESLGIKDLEKVIYGIPKQNLQESSDVKLEQKTFFTNVYQMLFGKEVGPRLPTYIWAQDREKIINLLDV